MTNSTFNPPPFLNANDNYKTTYVNDYSRFGPQLNSSSNPLPPFLTGSNSGIAVGTTLHAMTPVGSLPTSSFVQKNSMYTPNQWRTSNIQNVTNGEKERATAERLRDECARLRTETAIRTNRTQLDVNNKLDGRITDVNFWKEELNREHREIMEEIKMLQQFIGRLERALAATEKPLNVTRQNLDYRTRRVKIDLVYDNVEEVLNKEIKTIEDFQALLKKTLEQAMNQLWVLRNVKTMLENDIAGKFSALTTDSFCRNLNNHSKGLYYAPHAVCIQANSSTVDQWEGFSTDNMAKAERERKASVALRSEINGILMQSFADLRGLYENVNNIFQRRIEETAETKKKLERELARVIDEINAMQHNIDNLKMAIAEKENPLKLAHTRLDKRSRRPGIELCADIPQYRLVSEVGEINVSVDRLRQRMAEAERQLQNLAQQRATLEDDINTKTNTLFLDRDQCMTIRKQVRHIQH